MMATHRTQREHICEVKEGFNLPLVTVYTHQWKTIKTQRQADRQTGTHTHTQIILKVRERDRERLTGDVKQDGGGMRGGGEPLLDTPPPPNT